MIKYKLIKTYPNSPKQDLNEEETKEFSKAEFEEFEQSLFPKTKWDIEIIDGKIKLI